MGFKPVCMVLVMLFSAGCRGKASDLGESASALKDADDISEKDYPYRCKHEKKKKILSYLYFNPKGAPKKLAIQYGVHGTQVTDEAEGDGTTSTGRLRFKFKFSDDYVKVKYKLVMDQELANKADKGEVRIKSEGSDGQKEEILKCKDKWSKDQESEQAVENEQDIDDNFPGNKSYPYRCRVKNSSDDYEGTEVIFLEPGKDKVGIYYSIASGGRAEDVLKDLKQEADSAVSAKFKSEDSDWGGEAKYEIKISKEVMQGKNSGRVDFTEENVALSSPPQKAEFNCEKR